MPTQANPTLVVDSSAAVHLGGLAGYDTGLIVFSTTAPLHIGGSSAVTNSGSGRGSLVPAGTYRFDLSADDDLYAIAPVGSSATVELLSLLHEDVATELRIGAPDSSGIAVPSAYGEAAWLEDAQSNELDLTTILDDQYKQGLDGRFMPTVAHQIDTVPGEDGGRYRLTTAGLGALTLPLLVVGESPDELRRKLNCIAQGVNPKKGPQTLHIVTSDAVHRTIPVIYESGFSTDPATAGEEYETLLSLTFRALDSYWSDTTAVEYVLTKQTQATTLFPVSFPVPVGASSVFAVWTVENPGDVEVALKITLAGSSGRDFALTNDDTGESISIESGLVYGRSIVLDGTTRTVTDQQGNDLFPLVQGDFWDLPAGFTRVTAQLFDASDDAVLRISSVPKYIGV